MLLRASSAHQLHVAEEGLEQGALAGADAADNGHQLARAHRELGNAQLKCVVGRVLQHGLQRQLGGGGTVGVAVCWLLESAAAVAAISTLKVSQTTRSRSHCRYWIGVNTSPSY